MSLRVTLGIGEPVARETRGDLKGIDHRDDILVFAGVEPTAPVAL